MRIHQITGKEKGMMVIGEASEIRSFGSMLVESTGNLPEKENAEWPPLLAELDFTNAPGYTLSFHLETTEGAIPKSSGFHSEILKTFIFVFAIIGIISVVRWFVNVAL